MLSLSSFRQINLSLRNPIARAEFDHIQRQTHTGKQSRRLRWGIGIVLFILFIIYLTNVLNQYRAFSFIPALRMAFPVIVLAMLTTGVHFNIIFRTVLLAGETLAREKRANNWDTLLMTGISARQLVLGKWWAVICAVWKEFLALALIRGLVTVLFAVFVLSNGTFSLTPTSAEVHSQAIPKALLALCLMYILTMMNMLLTVSAGIVGSLLNNTQTSGASSALVVRLATLISPMIILLPIVFYLLNLYGDDFEHPMYFVINILGLMQLTLFDNGAITGSALANPNDTWGTLHLLTLVLSIGLYVFLIVMLLWLGVVIAKRQGVAQ